MRSKFYEFNLMDCTTPSFVSFTKGYYGTIVDFQKFIDGLEGDLKTDLMQPFEILKEGVYVDYDAGNIKARFARPVNVVARKEVKFENIHFSFTNTWGFTYEIDIDELVGELIVLRVKKKMFVSCLKVTTKNARIVDDIVGEKLPPMMLGDMFWGFPQMIKAKKIGDDIYLKNSLYAVEKVFETKEEALARFNSDEPLNLQDFFWDVFGDG